MVYSSVKFIYLPAKDPKLNPPLWSPLGPGFGAPVVELDGASVDLEVVDGDGGAVVVGFSVVVALVVVGGVLVVVSGGSSVVVVEFGFDL